MPTKSASESYALRVDTRYRFDYLPFYEDGDLFESVVLYQVGDMATKSGYRMGQHVQHYHEVCYIASGMGKMQINDAWYTVMHGDIVIIRQGDIHDIVTDDHDPMRLFYFEYYVRPAAREQAPYCNILSLFESASDSRKSICRAQDTIPLIFEGIFSEMVQQKSFYGSVIESYSLQLLVSVFRSFKRDDRPSTASLEGKSSLARELAHYLDEHFNEISNLNELTNVFKYSYSYLAHVFKVYIGISIYQYYDKKRFDYATRLLQDGNTSITEISEKLNYQSVNAFSKAFSKKFGISPSAYVITYLSNTSQKPQYEQGEKLFLHDSDDGDILVYGTLFFCGGCCVTSIAPVPSDDQPASDKVGRLGHEMADIDDPVYD